MRDLNQSNSVLSLRVYGSPSISHPPYAASKSPKFRYGEDAPRGDLYLLVRLAPHPRYRVDGRDITVELPVPPWDATLGAKAPVETPGGRVEVKVPAGSSSGRRLRLRGRGLPNPRGAAGDLYAEVRIVTPQRLTAEQRKAWEALAETYAEAPEATDAA